ncbi:phosphatidate cytidylyltransferase [Salipaludibacillus sp. LMS25]|jgi:phosphatidate cytidylyltransferase|uniref:phosphatidate cytidylyltransferase n=1 Tax=Salipaludibacillus sp. LMS25 TaxID=2924031 RepID=UPI0020D0CA98|nr:phosphatidate cytidylyltransferase [Salipaludibacillus sp. LMS25]UTR15065.1 phosphatidate cytidylyltransferase [Salipaludibacillus sp. LMS25]
MKERIITGVIGGAAIISLIIIGNLPFTLVMVALASIAMWELLRMKKIQPFSIRGIIGMLFMWMLLIPESVVTVFDWVHLERLELFLLLIIVLLALTVITKNKFTFDEAGFVVLASVYVGFGFHYFMHARFLENGLAMIFFILIIVWSTDSGAYFAGRRFGKHKLWPEISPKKTIEGSVGGTLLALLIGSIYTVFFPVFSTWMTTILFMVVVSLAGQLGDLVESAFKRHYAVKDSGHVLPGHGGILDRFDSLIFVMPIIYLLGFL